ncbi:MAG: methyl coenzyme M reductase-arginine methyltransferase Mmp10 [Methanobrevibacter sp.]|uniref:methyl coenzyme M reductase-arginine methyltransferase Mmp10 n=1 Tax=Methanobrevibacter sp. TaxID=66852 RepID=UPI0025F2239D|nr:methyl coenzyme M reductase-arginine methyltransferase Mmp10 [Methanobrevibacter sp.]MBR3113495.1 methyl coenzyme M reductase-arginine methyltransferase Mmp10 [Methanobrevibacter sp.]MBR6993771.1 methyl coenzyme M reductase-arginine methyltransferase Mmp10 [Methanobrevibacter sp.]
MQLVADVGGIPGKDCNGFCKYCYFRKVKEVKSFGCAHCLPNKIGCERCSKGINEAQSEFKPPFQVMNEVQTALMMSMTRGKATAYISGGGDISCYPHLETLTAGLNQYSIPSILGYTCGKGISDSEMASRLINNGVEEVSFTIFSSDPQLRKEWVKDKHPQEALDACKIFCENIKLTGAAVIIPGVNDGEVLRQTCNDLEEWGAKGMLLMRFANTFNEGLILGNEPILKGIESQPVEEFAELVKQINSEYKFRVSGTPLCDPETGGPFAIAKDENEIFLQFIKPVTGEATIITSKIAEPFISKIFNKLEVDSVNVVAVEKEIACLITKEDLEKLDLSEIKEAVIIPGRSFVHQLDAERILSADGIERIVGRGPDTLSVDGELSIDMTDENVIERELEQFNDLVDAINFFGMRLL